MDYPLVQYGCDKCGELTEVMDCDQPLPEGWTCGDGRHTHYCPKCSNIKKKIKGMMTDRTKTPQMIFLQENYGKQEYGIEQDSNVRGMVRYFRCDEDYNKIKRVLAMSLMDFLDNNKPEGKMCLSNGECKNIDDAFALGDWDMIFRYIEKYIK